MTQKNKELEFESFELNEDVEIDTSLFDSLVENEVLTEEESTSVKDSYEAAVKSGIKKLLNESVVPHYEGQMETLLTEARETITEEISDYLEYVVEEFIEEQKDQIVASETSKQDRELVEGLVDLLKKSYVEIPEGRQDLVENLSSELAEAKDENSELEEEVIQLRTQIKGQKCETIFEELSSDLTKSQTEKFLELVEDLSVNDVEEFERKARNIRSNMFAGKSNEDGDETLTEDLEEMDGDDTPLTEAKNQRDRVLQEAAAFNRRSKLKFRQSATQ